MIKLTHRGSTYEIEEIGESWYDYGYIDAIDFYFGKINEGVDIATFKTRDAVKELFAKRVIKYNSENNQEVPISTFRINK